MTLSPDLSAGAGLVDTLGEIGPRPAGSIAAQRAAAAIEGAFQALGARTRRQSFTFLGYEPEDPTLEVAGVHWSAAACLYASPTPAAGVQGRAREIGLQQIIPNLLSARCFAIEDDDRHELARLYASPLPGGPITLPSGYGPTLTGPAAWVSNADADRLAASAESQVAVTVRGRFANGSRDANVIATSTGRSDGRVIVCAHHDSVWNGPGLVDNASGVEAVRRVLANQATREAALSLEVCCFAAEEFGLLGSRFYVAEAKLRGELSGVRAVVNVDCIGHGPRLVLQATAGPLAALVAELAGKYRLDRLTEVAITPPGPGSDHHPFALEGVPVVALLHFPYPQYHQPREPAGLLDPELFEAELGFVIELTEVLRRGHLDLAG